MLDQLLGLVLLGLGVQSPVSAPMVKGDSVEVIQGGEDPTGTPPAGCTYKTVQCFKEPCPAVLICNDNSERSKAIKAELERRSASLETKRKEMEAQYKAKREQLKTGLLEKRTGYELHKSTDSGEFRKHVEEEREAYIASVKARIEQSTADREEKIAAFKEKMNAFKDQAMKTKVEDIQSRITAFVAKRIETMTAQITRMSDIVGLNKEQVVQKASGKDTTSFDTAAAAALTAINTAKDKVSALSTKQYVVTITSETTVKTDVEAVRKTVETDMNAANELMKNARVAISKMIQERAKLLGETIPESVVK